MFGGKIMYTEFIRNRINALRMKHNLSEYQLSLDLGRSQGYIQSITSGRTLPSMDAFLDICDYFNITPSEFFDTNLNDPTLYQDVIKELKALSENDLLLLLMVLKRINNK